MSQKVERYILAGHELVAGRTYRLRFYDCCISGELVDTFQYAQLCIEPDGVGLDVLVFAHITLSHLYRYAIEHIEEVPAENDDSRIVPFDPDMPCDACGQLGAFDFMGDGLCPDCLR